MHMRQDANEDFKLYFASFFKMSIWIRDFSNKASWTRWPSNPVSKKSSRMRCLEATNLKFSGLIQLFFPRWCHTWAVVVTHGSWAWSMVLNPGANAVATAVPTRRVGYKLRAVPGGSSSSESGAARSLARNGLVLGAKKSQQFAPFQFLLVDFCWWLTFELFPVYIYTCFSKYWISSAILVEHCAPKCDKGAKLATLNNYPADNAGRAKGAKIWHCHQGIVAWHPNLQLLFRVQLTVRSL